MKSAGLGSWWRSPAGKTVTSPEWPDSVGLGSRPSETPEPGAGSDSPDGSEPGTCAAHRAPSPRSSQLRRPGGADARGTPVPCPPEIGRPLRPPRLPPRALPLHPAAPPGGAGAGAGSGRRRGLPGGGGGRCGGGPGRPPGPALWRGGADIGRAAGREGRRWRAAARSWDGREPTPSPPVGIGLPWAPGGAVLGGEPAQRGRRHGVRRRAGAGGGAGGRRAVRARGGRRARPQRWVRGDRGRCAAGEGSGSGEPDRVRRRCGDSALTGAGSGEGKERDRPHSLNDPRVGGGLWKRAPRGGGPGAALLPRRLLGSSGRGGVARCEAVLARRGVAGG